jgi:hypothetical protein
MALKGGRELRARLKALRVAFKPIGRTWADGTVEAARPKVPQRTGRLRRSIRVKNSTQRKATVAAHFTAFFVDAGPKPHAIKAKKANRLIFSAGGRTIFARKVNHPGYRGRPFRAQAAHESLRRNPMAQSIIKQWNEAA